jgi:hypothetical protein
MPSSGKIYVVRKNPPVTLRDIINSLRANERNDKKPNTNSVWVFLREWKAPPDLLMDLYYLLKTSRDYREISNALERVGMKKDDLENMVLQATIMTAPKDFKHMKELPPAAEMAAALMEEGYDWTPGNFKALAGHIAEISNVTVIPEDYLKAVDKAADDWLES